MRVLVLGASGFIGGRIARKLAEAGHAVRAGARHPRQARRLSPGLDWVEADFARLSEASSWAPLIVGVDAVVNCVGVLQDGGGDSTQAAHVTGPQALIAACQAAGVRRLVHISAVGADDAAGTDYARSKHVSEEAVAASNLDWVIVRPSLVISRAVYGGTALMRGLAAFPGMIPVIGGRQVFRPVSLDDLVQVVARLVEPSAPARLSLDVAGPEAVSLAELLRKQRAWLGLRPAPVISVPRALAQPVLWIGDLLGRLGWTSPLRTTSLRQMDHDVAGDPSQWTQVLGLHPLSVTAWLAAHPATVQDRWHARLYFVRPLAIALLATFWIGSGLIALGPGRAEAAAILTRAGLGSAAGTASDLAAVWDAALGAALLVRSWTARVAGLMALTTLGYLLMGSTLLPGLWLDPLGPWLKATLAIPLCLFVAATDARR